MDNQKIINQVIADLKKKGIAGLARETIRVYLINTLQAKDDLMREMLGDLPECCDMHLYGGGKEDCKIENWHQKWLDKINK